MNKNIASLMKVAPQISLLLGLSIGIITLNVFPRYQQGKLTFNSSALAQMPSDVELRRYSSAATQIEQLRQSAYSNIRNAVGSSNSVSLACHQPQNFSRLPNEARNFAVEYCEQSERIVEQNGLSINDFNRITRQLKSNPQLYKRLEQMMNP